MKHSSATDSDLLMILTWFKKSLIIVIMKLRFRFTNDIDLVLELIDNRVVNEALICN